MPTSVATDLRRVQVVDPLRTPWWDDAVQALPGASFFHSRAWASVLRDTYGYGACYVTAHEGDRLAGVLPMMEIDSWLTGRRGVSLPFSDVCEPLAVDDDVLHELVAVACSHGAARRWKYAEFRGGRTRLNAPSAGSYYAHHLDLTPGPAALLLDIDGAARRSLRKAERNSVHIEFSREQTAVRCFHHLLCQTRQRHGLPPQPIQFFDQIHRHILTREKGVVLIARHAGRPIAGAVFFHYGRTAVFKYGASDEEYQQLRPNNLLMWRAIEWHAQAGFQMMDFGRTDIGHEGLRRFKLGWGTTESTIHYVRHDFRRHCFIDRKRDISRWQSAVFRHIPLTLSRAIGSALYRHAA